MQANLPLDNLPLGPPGSELLVRFWSIIKVEDSVNYRSDFPILHPRSNFDEIVILGFNTQELKGSLATSQQARPEHPRKDRV